MAVTVWTVTECPWLSRRWSPDWMCPAGVKPLPWTYRGWAGVVSRSPLLVRIRMVGVCSWVKVLVTVEVVGWPVSGSVQVAALAGDFDALVAGPVGDAH